MASTTITISSEAYKLLKDAKRPGDSFSDVIVSYIRPPARTAGELLERLEQIEPPLIDRALMQKIRAGRGRRARGKAARAA